ncbi:MAG: SEL1-like repeat protein, partial [Treponema sp.]|nr:SEL1-like repeat protein [Treponema sp.]MCL2251362.1 SEL1-like repeat protein [Treponema sp.]
KATDQGSSAAQFNLGWCYYKGFGVAQDLATAVELFRKAAAQGYANAQKELDKLKSEGKI